MVAQTAVPAETIHAYLTTNIHYILDEECIEGMKGFFRMAAETGVLPAYDFDLASEHLSDRGLGLKHESRA